jgi:phosphoribosylformylglycinamidine (FGAM) synthase-like amidotransferase family enzyme
MKSAVILFPGINRETDMARALHAATGIAPHIVWHTEYYSARRRSRRRDRWLFLR